MERELQAMIKQATTSIRLNQLDPMDQAVVELAYFEGADYRTIARIQGEGRAETLGRLTRALNLLLGPDPTSHQSTR